MVRDKWGRPHIYATSVPDAMLVEGYVVALDRTLQLEFYRRVSEGRLAEILSDLSPAAIDLDITYRHIGLARTAAAEYAALTPGPLKDAVDAYASGVTQAFQKIRSGEAQLPEGLSGIPTAAFTDWTAVDSLAIARFQTYELSYGADEDIANQQFFDAARSTFSATDPDPLIAKRAGLERDLFRFAPGDPATTTTGYPVLENPKAPARTKHQGPRARPRRAAPPRVAPEEGRRPLGDLRLPRGHAADAQHVHARRLRLQQLGGRPLAQRHGSLDGRQRLHPLAQRALRVLAGPPWRSTRPPAGTRPRISRSPASPSPASRPSSSATTGTSPGAPPSPATT